MRRFICWVFGHDFPNIEMLSGQVRVLRAFSEHGYELTSEVYRVVGLEKICCRCLRWEEKGEWHEGRTTR